MNGGSKPIIWFCAALFALCELGGRTGAGEASAEGYVTVDGKKPGSLLYVEILHDGQPLGLVEVDEDGRFRIPADISRDAQVVLLPHNEKALRTQETTFLSGYAQAKASDVASLRVSLTREKIVSQCIQIVDDSGIPVRNVDVQCSAAIPFSQEGEPNVTWTRRWTASSDGEGIVNLRVIQIDKGAYELSVNAEGLDGNRYVGKLHIFGKEVAKAGQSPMVWKVTRKRLALIIRCIWDPEFSKEPFRPDVGGNMRGHTVVLNEKPSTETLMKRDGTISFYDLPSGKYHISFLKGIEPVYSITRSSEELDIPVEAKQPITHILSLKPIARETWKLQGIVRDSRSGHPVSGAFVRCGRNVAKSRDDGSFALEVFPEERLMVEHAEYDQGTFPVPALDNSKLVFLSIRPYPSLSGKVLTGEQKPSALAELRFISPGRDFKATCNKKGEFRLRLKSGPYQLRIKVPIVPEDGKPARWPLPSARLFDGPFVMPKRDLNQDFQAPAVAKVAIKVQWDRDVLGEGRPVALCLLRESDKKIMASGQIADGAETVLYALEGKYTVLAVANDQRGALCGEIDIAQNDEGAKQVQIARWKPMRIDPMGIPRFTTPSPRQ